MQLSEIGKLLRGSLQKKFRFEVIPFLLEYLNHISLFIRFWRSPSDNAVGKQSSVKESENMGLGWCFFSTY